MCNVWYCISSVGIGGVLAPYSGAAYITNIYEDHQYSLFYLCVATCESSLLFFRPVVL